MSPKNPTNVVRSEAGITLLEVVIVMTLVGILTAFLSSIISYEADAYHKLVNQTDDLQIARNALRMMSRDLRHIMAPDSIFFAAADSIKTDIVDDSLIFYKLANNQILRNGDLLMNSVQGLQFSYFDSAGSAIGSPVSNPSQIRTIDISLTTLLNNQTFNLTAKVQPRNF